jgi:hypothetical protein
MLIEIDYDAISNVTVKNLQNDYISLSEQIVALERKKKSGKIKDHEKEDLKYNKKYRDGIEICLSYYMPSSQAEEFVKRSKYFTKKSFSVWDDF